MNSVGTFLILEKGITTIETVDAFMVLIVHFCKCLADAMFYLYAAYVTFIRLLLLFSVTPYIIIRAVKAWHELCEFLRDKRTRRFRRRNKKSRQ
ncbi:hypothetical protein [Ligilactobacillus salivarius]|uniref:hypothetical protein n=1 Tax=Ligilactobacillus salivarius TaxID=1624 RepID=UPI0019D53D32|nr:hypothetical protein [Ligilactobacillus salivarius]